MVLGKLPLPGRPTILITVGQGPIALAVGATVRVVLTFLLSTILSPLSPSLWETARYRLKYCLKGPLNPKQPTNQPTYKMTTRVIFSIQEPDICLCRHRLTHSYQSDQLVGWLIWAQRPFETVFQPISGRLP